MYGRKGDPARSLPALPSGSIFKLGVLGVIGVLNDRCPVCGLAFLREAGYFLGAMHISYTASAS